MKTKTTIAWIYISVAYASEKGPAGLSEIIGIADGINKAIPTHKELQSTLGQLLKSNLIEKVGKKYKLTEMGNGIFENERKNNKTIFGILGALSRVLPNDDSGHLDHEITPNRVNKSYDKYHSEFQKAYKKIGKEG
jgi:hypothetical protein